MRCWLRVQRLSEPCTPVFGLFVQPPASGPRRDWPRVAVSFSCPWVGKRDS